LARARREKEERQDEQCRCKVRIEPDLAGGQAQLERDQHDRRVAKRVVVERSQRLHRKERREAALAEQTELIHGFPRGTRLPKPTLRSVATAVARRGKNRSDLPRQRTMPDVAAMER